MVTDRIEQPAAVAAALEARADVLDHRDIVHLGHPDRDASDQEQLALPFPGQHERGVVGDRLGDQLRLSGGLLREQLRVHTDQRLPSGHPPV